jgi:translation initiation factor IF-1
MLIGTVVEVRSDQARIDTGEELPRFVPIEVREAKGLPDLKIGDGVEITVNDQNLLVDVHLIGETSHHRVVEGQLIQSLVTHAIRPVARSKMASVPVGVDAVFLIDEADRIVDVIFGDMAAVSQAAKLWAKTTPLKGNFNRVIGTILTPLQNNRIAIQTDDGEEQPYDVRPLAQLRVVRLSYGDAVILLVDNEGKVTGVAIPPRSSDSDRG